MTCSKDQMSTTYQETGIDLQRSNLYNLLPSILRNSLAPLRRSISEYRLGSRREATSVVMHRRLESERGYAVQDDKTLSRELDMGRKFARHGCDLLQTAVTESQYPDPQSQAFSRQLYINSIAYLLQGLPTHLTDEELQHLRHALPHSLGDSARTKAIKYRKQQPTILHRGVAASILAICLFVRIALPYIKYLLAIANNYERTHHVTENVLTMGMNTAESLGKKSMEIARTALENKILTDTVTYCVEGICGGLTEGLEGGIRAIEAKKDV